MSETTAMIDESVLRAQLDARPWTRTDFPAARRKYEGKVRDCYTTRRASARSSSPIA